MWFLATIGIIIVLILILYNNLVQLRMKVKRSKSGIDIYLQQRFDLIPNLVNIVKGYMNYEQNLLESITSLRASYNENKDINVSQELNNKLNHILALVENYPELKANEHFLNLQKQLAKMESQLQAARRIYNIDVTNYNTKIHMIPFNILANLFNFTDEPLFEIENNDARENINVKF